MHTTSMHIYTSDEYENSSYKTNIRYHHHHDYQFNIKCIVLLMSTV